MVAVSGLGSGLDIDALVNGLVNAERISQDTRLVNKEKTTTNLISAFGQLKGVLSGLQGKLAPLKDPDLFAGRTGSSTKSSAVGISVDKTANVGSYSMTVESLATTQSFASGSYADATTVVGEGTLTLSFGSPTYAGTTPDTYTAFTADPEFTPVEIDISAANGNNTLEGVRDAINEADAGVKASLVKDGVGYRLLLTTEETGVENSLSISVTNDLDANNTDNAGLSALAFDATTSNLELTRAATDAEYTIDGLSLTSASNSITNALDGVTLTLKEVTADPATLTVQENRSAITSAIESFVETYNEYLKTSDNLTSYDPEARLRGPLQGDFSARSIKSQMRNALTNPAPYETGTYEALSQIGITTNQNGQLEFDSSALNEALDTDPDSVVNIFADTEVDGIEREGLATRLDNLLTQFVGSDSLLSNRLDSLDVTIDRITDDRDALNARMEVIEARYRSQFNALDGLLAQITSSGDFLLSQLENLPGYSSGSKK